jgi:serine/threonine protein kinase
MTNLIGQTLGRYYILEQLGEGGMAIVFKAYDSHLEREVAIKVIRTEKLSLDSMAKSLKRFEREAKSLARLTHPNIVTITDYGKHEGSPYLVMEYLPGGTLKERLKHAPLPWQEAVQLLLPIAQALKYAYEQNIIHRDVKPSNILLTSKGQPILTDFGVAKLFDLDETQDLTGTSMGIGTPEYMSPEQSIGKDIDGRSDIYSLGIVLYEMITGRKPFIGDTPLGVMIKKVSEPLPRPSNFVRNIPDRLEKILIKALAKDPEDRFENMGELIQVLISLMESSEPSESNFSYNATQEVTYDTFDMNVGNRTATSTAYQKTNSYEIPQINPPAHTPGWLLWVVGTLGLCVVGLASIAIIVLTTVNERNSNKDASLNPELPFSTLAPTSFVQAVPLPTDTSLPPTNFPILTPTDTATLTPITNTPIGTNTPICSPEHPPLLQPNKDAKVCTSSERLIIREFSGLSAPEIFRIYTGTVIRVLDGPVCVDEFWWWKVNIYPDTPYGFDTNNAPTWNPIGTTEKDTIGWAREGWDNKDTYYLCQ